MDIRSKLRYGALHLNLPRPHVARARKIIRLVAFPLIGTGSGEGTLTYKVGVVGKTILPLEDRVEK